MLLKTDTPPLPAPFVALSQRSKLALPLTTSAPSAVSELRR